MTFIARQKNTINPGAYLSNRLINNYLHKSTGSTTLLSSTQRDAQSQRPNQIYNVGYNTTFRYTTDLRRFTMSN